MSLEDSDSILEWIRHKNIKMKDWIVIFAFEYTQMSDFDGKKL